jgi:uncharacterized protein (TIGR01777 family)
MQTVLITGGTGLIGTALSNSLAAKGYRVIIMSRNKTGKAETGHKYFACWDIKKQQIDIEAVQNADFIVNLAGAGVVDKKWTNGYKREIVKSRTESCRLIVDTLKKYDNKVRAVVSASASGWYGADENAGKAFTETDKAAENFLGQACKHWEESIEPVTNLGKRLVKLRIGIVLSNDGGALAEFKKPLRLGVAAILGNGKQVVSWIHIQDLCQLFITALENDSLHGSYNAVAPEPVTNKILTISLAKKMNGRYYIPFYVPSFILKLVLGQRSIEVLKSATLSCRKILDTGFTFSFTGIEAALDDLVKK